MPPFEKWAVFLHPLQRDVVERDYSGPVRVAGSAGTGKTVVALHRVMRILRSDPEARVLLTTFSDPLAESLERKLKILAGGRENLDSRVTVASFRRIAEELHALTTGRNSSMSPPPGQGTGCSYPEQRPGRSFWTTCAHGQRRRSELSVK